LPKEWTTFLLVARHHLWMYNQQSLLALAPQRICKSERPDPSGETSIPNPDALNSPNASTKAFT
jgi:hypothetical protein